MVTMTIFLMFIPSFSHAQNDTIAYQMGEVEVRTQRFTSKLRSDASGTTHWNMSMMKELPKILGNADPLHYAQMLPAVQTNSEFDAGLHVQGCSTGQSLIKIGQATVYNPAHMLGFFSTFNPNHFSTLTFRTYADAATPNVVGGTLSMDARTASADSLSGTLDVGLISSQATVRLPLSKQQQLTVSARQSYINLLYGSFIRMDDSQFRYNFGDYNLTYQAQNDRHEVTVNAFYSRDEASMQDDNIDLNMRLRWQNLVLSAESNSRTRCEGLSIQQALSFSSYHNQVWVSQSLGNGSVPSSIQTILYNCMAQKRFRSRSNDLLRFGVNAEQHTIIPQYVNLQADFNVDNETRHVQHATEASPFADYRIQLTDVLSLTAGVKLSMYRLWEDNQASYLHPSPHLCLSYHSSELGDFNLRYSHTPQYLHQSGFSSMGLPTEFRFAASSVYKPQVSDAISLHYTLPILNGSYRLTAEVYGKFLQNQTEYHGDIFSFYTSGYNMGNTLVTGKGYNYGFNLQLIKQTGRLTGWISYAYGRSMRIFPQLSAQQYFPSNYERPHEFNLVATYSIKRRWNLGGTFVFASGTPFTAIKQIYYVSNSLVAEFGDHNANRLSPYCRLDLSLTYHLNNQNKRYKSHLNLSLYNALFYKNDIFYRLKIYDDHFAYRAVFFMLRTLPSLSYHLDF